MSSTFSAIKVNKISKIYSDMHSNIQDVFNEYEVAIMTPHYNKDTPEAKLVLKDQWFVSPADTVDDNE